MKILIEIFIIVYVMYFVQGVKYKKMEKSYHHGNNIFNLYGVFYCYAFRI